MSELNMFLQAARTLEALEKENKRMIAVWVKYLEEGLKGSSIDWPKVNTVLESMSKYSRSRGHESPTISPSDGSPRWDENRKLGVGTKEGGPLTKTDPKQYPRAFGMDE